MIKTFCIILKKKPFSIGANNLTTGVSINISPLIIFRDRHMKSKTLKLQRICFSKFRVHFDFLKNQLSDFIGLKF